MAKWIPLDQLALNPPTRETIRGADVIVYLSIYDVPEAVSGEYDDTIKKFVISFKYVVQDESFEIQREGEMISLRIGKYSGRLYGIELDVHKMKATHVNLAIVPKVVGEAIDKLEADPRRGPRFGNYRVAKKVLTERGGELLRGSGLK